MVSGEPRAGERVTGVRSRQNPLALLHPVSLKDRHPVIIPFGEYRVSPEARRARYL